MTHHRESPDDTIDRVAAALTLSPPDPAIPARVAERIRAAASTRLPWARWSVAAAGLAAVAGMVFVAGINRLDTPPQTQTVSAPLAAPANVTGTVPTPTIDALAARREPAATQPRYLSHTLVVQPIDALPSPALVTVDDIIASPLTIAPVEIAPLDVADLAIASLDGVSDRKE